MSLKFDKSFFINLVLSLTSVYSIQGMMKAKNQSFELSNSIWGLILFMAFLALYSKIKDLSVDKRLIIISSLCGFCFSSSMVIGSNVLVYSSTNIGYLSTWLHIFFGIPIFAGLTVVFFEIIIPKLNFLSLSSKKLNDLLKTLFKTNKNNFFVYWILIFLAWLPGLIASFPGVYGYDAIYQLKYYTTGKIILHHPLIHTYLLGFCVKTLGSFFGSYAIGMAIYSVIQMLLLSCAFSATLFYMTKIKTPKWLMLLFLLIYIFLPTNAIMSFSSTKDIIFTAFFIFVSLLLLQMADNPEIIEKFKFCFVFGLCFFFNIIFRSSGIYVFIFSSVVGLLIFRKKIKKLLVVILFILAVFVIYSGPISKSLHAVKYDSIHEMLSVPIMQLSRAATFDSQKISSKQKRKISMYIPTYYIYSNGTSEGISDGMKNTFNSALFKKSPTAFLKLWFDIGRKEPLAYIDAFARLTIGYWYPDMNYRDPQAYHPYWEYNMKFQKSTVGNGWLLVQRHTPKMMKWLNNFYENLTYENNYQKVPVISMAFSSGIVIWMVLLYLAFCIYKRAYKYLYFGSFLLGTWLILILGPVVLYRYIYPIISILPLQLASVLHIQRAEH